MLLSQDRFETDVLGAQGPVLVDFYATWCPPCKALAPIIDRIADDGHAVSKVNIEERPDLAVQFGVSNVPTVVIFQNGKEVARFVGLQSERTLRGALDRARAAA
jgi:thioredoxin 1